MIFVEILISEQYEEDGTEFLLYPEICRLLHYQYHLSEHLLTLDKPTMIHFYPEALIIIALAFILNVLHFVTSNI